VFRLESHSLSFERNLFWSSSTCEPIIVKTSTYHLLAWHRILVIFFLNLSSEYLGIGFSHFYKFGDSKPTVAHLSY